MCKKVKLGDDKKVDVMGKCSTKVETKESEKKHNPNMYYLPILKHNLISIGQLQQKRYKSILKMMHMRFLILIEN